MKLIVVIVSLILACPARATGGSGAEATCDSILLLENPINMSIALHSLKQALDEAPGAEAIRDRSWYQLLSDYVSTRDGEDRLMAISIVGGGNAGKSTLFNSLSSLITGTPNLHLDQPLSQVGSFPGLTKRMVIAANDGGEAEEELRRRFGRLDPWVKPEQSSSAGSGLLAFHPEIPRDLAFVDSPDFDTGSAAGFEPDNLKKAQRVIYPADVLMLLVDSRTVRNQANVKMLSSTFRLYGKKKTIFVYLADPSVSQNEIRDLLLDLSNSIYGTQGRRFSDGVLGAYVMPYSLDVAAGRALADLNPLPEFPDFKTLVGYMRDHAEQIKKYSQKSAIEGILAGSREFWLSHQRRRMALQIWEKALKVIARDSGLHSAGDFHYLEVRDVLRNKFRSFDGQLRNLIYQFGNLTAIPDRMLLNAFQHFRPSQIIARRMSEDHKAHDRVAVAQMIAELQTGRIATIENSDEEVQALQNESRQFFSEFIHDMEDIPSDQIRLPPITYLPESVRREYQALIESDPESAIIKLGQLIDSVQFDPRESLSRHDLNHALSRFHALEKRWRAVSVGLLDLGTVLAPAGSAYWLAQNGVNNTLIWLAVIVGSARPLRWWSDHIVDAYLQREINRWYHGLQLEATEVFFSKTLAGPLNAALARELTVYQSPQFVRLQSAVHDADSIFNTFYSEP